MIIGSKYQSNLNEIDKSEQKSGSETDSKGGMYGQVVPNLGISFKSGKFSPIIFYTML